MSHREFALEQQLDAAEARIRSLEEENVRLKGFADAGVLAAEALEEENRRLKAWGLGLAKDRDKAEVMWLEEVHKRKGAESSLSRLTAKVEQLIDRWQQYRTQWPRSFNVEQLNPKAVEREHTLMDVFIRDLADLLGSLPASPKGGEVEC